MTEKSASREVRRILEKIERDRRILRAIGAIVSRSIIGQIIFPNEVADATTTEINTAKAIQRRIEQEAQQRIENAKRIADIPIIDGRSVGPGGAQPSERLEPITPREFAKKVPLPTQEISRVEAPRIPRRAPAPVQRPRQILSSPILRSAIGVIATGAISRAVRSRSPTRTPFVDPVFPPQGIPTPLTPLQPRPLPSPQPIRPRTQEDLCRELAKQKRKKRRKCEQRLNVVWAGGPNKGKIAGTKCFDRFQGAN